MMRDMMNSIPQEILKEMAQLTKENSIEGCKAAEVDIVYTPGMNLNKEERMDVGQVGFKDESFRILIRHVEKDKEIVKKLEKSKLEKVVDFAAEKQQRDDEERRQRKQFLLEQKNKQK